VPAAPIHHPKVDVPKPEPTRAIPHDDDRDRAKPKDHDGPDADDNKNGAKPFLSSANPRTQRPFGWAHGVVKGQEGPADSTSDRARLPAAQLAAEKNFL